MAVSQDEAELAGKEVGVNTLHCEVNWSSDDDDGSDGESIAQAYRRLGTKKGPTVSLNGDTSRAPIKPRLLIEVAPDACRWMRPLLLVWPW